MLTGQTSSFYGASEAVVSLSPGLGRPLCCFEHVSQSLHGEAPIRSVPRSFEGIGPIRLPRCFVDEHAGPGGRTDVGVDHAYAVTSYAVQGATFERSTSRIDVGLTGSDRLASVATRGVEVPSWGAQIPPIPNPYRCGDVV